MDAQPHDPEQEKGQSKGYGNSQGVRLHAPGKGKRKGRGDSPRGPSPLRERGKSSGDEGICNTYAESADFLSARQSPEGTHAPLAVAILNTPPKKTKKKKPEGEDWAAYLLKTWEWAFPESDSDEFARRASVPSSSSSSRRKSQARREPSRSASVGGDMTMPMQNGMERWWDTDQKRWRTRNLLKAATGQASHLQVGHPPEVLGRSTSEAGEAVAFVGDVWHRSPKKKGLYRERKMKRDSAASDPSGLGRAVRIQQWQGSAGPERKGLGKGRGEAKPSLSVEDAARFMF